MRFADGVGGTADRARGVDRGDVEAGALGHLLEVDPRSRRIGERHLGEQLTRPQVDLLVAAVELLERHGPLRVAVVQHDAGIQRQQQGGEVADRGGVNDVAGQGGAVADLPRGDQVIERSDGGNRPDHRRVGAELLEGGQRADPELAAGAADPLQLGPLPQYGDTPLGYRLALLHIQVGATGDEQLIRGMRRRGRTRRAQGAQPLGNGGEVLRQRARRSQRRHAAGAAVGMQPAAEVTLQGGGAVLE